MCPKLVAHLLDLGGLRQRCFSSARTSLVGGIVAGHVALQLPHQQQNDDDEDDETAAAIVTGPAPAKAEAPTEENDEDDDQEHNAKRAQARQAPQSIGF